MKGMITALCFAVVIVAGSVWYTHEMTQISDELLEINTAVMQNLESDEFAAAVESANEMEQYLDNKRVFLAATDNHERLDAIEVYTEELLSFAEGGQKTDAISHCRALGLLIERIPRDYKLRAESIL